MVNQKQSMETENHYNDQNRVPGTPEPYFDMETVQRSCQEARAIHGGVFYLAVQKVQEGYQYLFLNQDFYELDRGMLTEPGLSITQATHALLSEEGWIEADTVSVEYESIMERMVEKV